MKTKHEIVTTSSRAEETNIRDFDEFIKYVNGIMKSCNSEDLSNNETIEKNNHFLYFLTKKGLNYLNKIDK